MFKKLITMFLTFAIAGSAVPVFADDTADNSGEVIRYDCNKLVAGGNWDQRMYNSIDSSKYTANVFSDVIYSNPTQVYKVNDITYPEKKYLLSPEDTTRIYTSFTDELYSELNDSFSADMWLNFVQNKDAILMTINDDSSAANCLFKVQYAKSENLLRVWRKMQNTDGTTKLTCYKYSYSFRANSWYHLAISLNETDGAIEPPTLLINGIKQTYNGIDNEVTADNGYSPVKFAKGESKDDSVEFGQGANQDGTTINCRIKYSKISLYNKALTEAELREKYETELGYYEPEYDIVVYDGLGSKVAQSGLNSIFSAGAATPSITIDTSTVTDSDITLFDANTVKVTDMTENKQLTLSGTASEAVYTVTSDEFVAGHEYLLTIDESVSDLRTKAQELEFSTTADVPELVSEYKMNTGDLVESVSGNTTVLGNCALTTDYKYDNAFYVPAKSWAPSYALNEMEKEALKGQYTVDLWFRKDASSKSNEKLLYSVTDKKSYYMEISRLDGNKLGIMLSYKCTDGTYKLRTYTTSADYTAKAWNHLIVAYDPTTNTVTGMLNGTAITFSGPYSGNYSTSSSIPDGAVPATPENTLRAYFNGTASMNGSGDGFKNTYGGQVSQNNIGAISIFKGAATTAYMQYLSGLNTDRYDYSYDLTLYQDGNEIAKEDLVNLTEGNIEAKINMTETETLSGNIYLINEAGEKTAGTVTWSTTDDVTTASVVFADVVCGDYDLIIDAGVAIGSVTRKSDYVLPITVVKKPTIELTADGDAVDENTSVAGKTVSANAKLEGADSAVLIVARYVNGVLNGVTTSSTVVDDTITISDVTVGSNESVKVMLWESLSGMAPMISSKSY